MKHALVTGGSGGIGAAICRQLAKDGFHVLVHANANMHAAEQVVEDIRRAGGTGGALQFDVTDTEACDNILAELAEHTPIQVVVNNAGIHRDAPMAGMEPEHWQKVIDVSLNGFFNVTRPLLMPMMRTRWGRIISISSVAGIMGNRGQANYAAAKSGLHGASKSLAIELASRGITVNVIAPGIIETDMSKGVFSQEQINALVPMKRAGRAEEVAALAGFLTSDPAAYISGQVIAVSGAMV